MTTAVFGWIAGRLHSPQWISAGAGFAFAVLGCVVAMPGIGVAQTPSPSDVYCSHGKAHIGPYYAPEFDYLCQGQRQAWAILNALGQQFGPTMVPPWKDNGAAQNALEKEIAKLRDRLKQEMANYKKGLDDFRKAKEDIERAEDRLHSMGYSSVEAAERQSNKLETEINGIKQAIKYGEGQYGDNEKMQQSLNEKRAELAARTAERDALDDALETYRKAERDATMAQGHVKAAQSEMNELNTALAQAEQLTQPLVTPYAEPYRQPGQFAAVMQGERKPSFAGGRVRWWSEAGFTAVDESAAARELDTALGRFSAGADVTLADRFALGLGVGVDHLDANGAEDSTLSGDGVSLIGRGFLGLNEDVWLDGSLSYGHHWLASSSAEARDDFDVNSLGFSAGINAVCHFNESWRLSGRFGWSGTWSHRDASVDSEDASQPADDVNFGRLSAGATLTRTLSGSGEIFADATLRYVTNDNSTANTTAHPFDAQLGGGIDFTLGKHLRLTASGYTVVGRDAYSENGASVKLSGDF